MNSFFCLCFTVQLRANVLWSLIDEPSDENSDDEDDKIFCIKLTVIVEPKPSVPLLDEQLSFRVVH